jgi:ribose 5-phosphate isomerase RpiB
VPRGNSAVIQHNNANIIVLGVDSLGKKLSAELIMTFLTSGFDHEERNMLRVNMFMGFEKEA